MGPAQAQGPTAPLTEGPTMRPTTLPIRGMIAFTPAVAAIAADDGDGPDIALESGAPVTLEDGVTTTAAEGIGTARPPTTTGPSRRWFPMRRYRHR